MRSRVNALLARAQPLEVRPELHAIFNELGVTLGRGAPFARVRKWLCHVQGLPAFFDAGFGQPADLLRGRYLFVDDSIAEGRWFLPRNRKFLKVSAFDRTAKTKDVRWQFGEDIAHNKASQQAFSAAGIAVPQTHYALEERHAHELLVSDLGGRTATRHQAAAAFVEMAAASALHRGDSSVQELVNGAIDGLQTIDEDLSHRLQQRLDSFPGHTRRMRVALSMVHGDASPGNLCLRQSGEPVLIDFDKCMVANAAFDLAHLFQSGDLNRETLADGASRALGLDVARLEADELLALVRLLFASDVAASIVRLSEQCFRAEEDRRCPYSMRLLASALG